MYKYCDSWNLRVNLNRSKMVVFRKDGRLKNNGKLYFKRQSRSGKQEQVVRSNYTDKIIFFNTF